VSKTLTELQREIGDWHADRMPGATESEVVLKFREEADEFVADDNGAEAADILIALLAHANLSGYSLEEMLDAKMAINRARSWARMPDGTYKHVEAQS
jgi:NTP pyrophosphatase (non-canonical NTP hydrolase)